MSPKHGIHADTVPSDTHLGVKHLDAWRTDANESVDSVEVSACAQHLELLAYAEACGSLQNGYAAMAEAVDSSEVRYLLLRYELLHARLLQELSRWQPAAPLGQSAPPVLVHADLPRAATHCDSDRAVLSALLRHEERLLERCRALCRTFAGLSADRLSHQARTLEAICRELTRVAALPVAPHRAAGTNPSVGALGAAAFDPTTPMTTTPMTTTPMTTTPMKGRS